MIVGTLPPGLATRTGMARSNVLVMAPGGYKALDFLSLGVGMSLVMAVVVIMMLS